ncbi:hypothetical protein NGA_0225300, partial [Nannochloropsis gaditana CCMP526]
MTQAVQEA